MGNPWNTISSSGLGLTSSRSHHHSAADSINWIWGQARDNSDTPAQNEWGQEWSTVTNEDWLSSIVDTEVQTTVDKDTDTWDDETTVKTANTVRSQCLLVDIDETIVLAFAVFAWERELKIDF